MKKKKNLALALVLVFVFSIICSHTQSEAVSYRTVLKCNSYVTLRKSPSTKAKALKKVNYGKTVIYLGSAKNGFAKVKYSGKTGYILKTYLASINNQATVDIDYGKVKMRSSASSKGKVIKTFTSYQEVYVYYWGRTYSKVNYRGKVGYILTRQLAGYGGY